MYFVHHVIMFDVDICDIKSFHNLLVGYLYSQHVFRANKALCLNDFTKKYIGLFKTH